MGRSDNNEKIKAKLDKLISEDPDDTKIIAHPDYIKKLIQQGVVKERFITWEEYTEKLYDKRKKDSVANLRTLPLLDDKIADSVATSIYEEIRASYAFSVFTSVIFNSILLLEYSMRARIYKEILKNNPKQEWSELEKANMGRLIPRLNKMGIVNKDEAKILDDFSTNLRNPYLHFNIYKLVQGIGITKLPRLKVDTLKIEEESEVDAKKYRFTWFSAKQFFDKERVGPILNFCIYWTNLLLKE